MVLRMDNEAPAHTPLAGLLPSIQPTRSFREESLSRHRSVSLCPNTYLILLSPSLYIVTHSRSLRLSSPPERHCSRQSEHMNTIMAHADGGHREEVLPLHHNKESIKELRHARTAHNMSSSSLRQKSDMALVAKVPWAPLRSALANLQEVFLGTKIFVLFPAIPLAIAADLCHFGSGWLFTLSLLGLIPLAERVSFLTEQIALYTGPTVGGLLNATCGNATELIISLLALRRGLVEVVKCSLVGSILSNLLLVLGSSLLLGGLFNLSRLKEQTFDRRQADVGMALLMLGVLSHVLPLLFRYTVVAEAAVLTAPPLLPLSRAYSIIMLVAYGVYIFFQLKTHRQMFESQEEDDDDDDDDDVTVEEEPVIGLASGVSWLVAMTAVIALLSEYVVGTIEEASVSWGLSVSFVSIILLPIVGNAAEHAGAISFACKNKLDIALGVSLGSAAQISVFVVPLSVVAAWIMGIPMDLDLHVLETASLMFAVLLTSVSLHDGTSHYLKGLILLLAYFAIGACFFAKQTPPAGVGDVANSGLKIDGYGGINRLSLAGISSGA